MSSTDYPLGTLLVAAHEDFPSSTGDVRIYVIRPEQWKSETMPDYKATALKNTLLNNGVVLAAIGPNSPLRPMGTCYLLNLSIMLPVVLNSTKKP